MPLHTPYLTFDRSGRLAGSSGPRFHPDPNSDTADTTGWTADSDMRTADGGVFSPPTPTWYDSIEPGSTNSDDTSDTTFSTSQKVVPGQNGDCTKLRVYESTVGASRTVKLALYDNSDNLLGSGSVAISPGSPADGNWIEVTLAVAVPVTGGVTYRVAWEYSANPGFTSRCLTGQAANSSFVNFGSSYAAFPQNPNSGTTGITNIYAAGMYVG